VTNLDFVELLLKEGADPNFHRSDTVAVYYRLGPGAAKFLLNWPATDANITTRSGASFLAKGRETVEFLCERAARPDNPGKIQDHFQLQ
jgi:hypothetical protein